jgi:hypothetical protein
VTAWRATVIGGFAAMYGLVTAAAILFVGAPAWAACVSALGMTYTIGYLAHACTESPQALHISEVLATFILSAFFLTLIVLTALFWVGGDISEH